jgi:hypothetical protein
MAGSGEGLMGTPDRASERASGTLVGAGARYRGGEDGREGKKKIRGLGNRYRGSDATVKNLWIGREEKKNAKKQQQL